MIRYSFKTECRFGLIPTGDVQRVQQRRAATSMARWMTAKLLLIHMHVTARAVTLEYSDFVPDIGTGIVRILLFFYKFPMLLRHWNQAAGKPTAASFRQSTSPTLIISGYTFDTILISNRRSH